MLRVIKQTVSDNLEQKHMADCLTFLSSRMPSGISVTISNAGVRANMGAQQFALSQNRYELQADVEALCRLNERRVSS